VDEREPALQTQVLQRYEVHLTEPADGSDLTRKVEELMMSESFRVNVEVILAICVR
jgi:hypothetical protein